MNCTLSHSAVHEYLDDELDAAALAEFEQHLQNCVQCQASLKNIETLREELLKASLYEHAPSELRARIRKQIAQPVGLTWLRAILSRRLILLPSVGALVAAIAVAFVFLVVQPSIEISRITAELTDAHMRSLQPGQLTELSSADPNALKSWFDGKLDFAPPMSDFEAQDFRLVGARLDVIDGRNTAALVYSHLGHFINLFVWRYDNDDKGFYRTGSARGYSWVMWQPGEIRFCLISDIAASDLRELKNLIRQ